MHGKLSASTRVCRGTGTIDIAGIDIAVDINVLLFSSEEPGLYIVLHRQTNPPATLFPYGEMLMLNRPTYIAEDEKKRQRPETQITEMDRTVLQKTHFM